VEIISVANSSPLKIKIKRFRTYYAITHDRRYGNPDIYPGAPRRQQHHNTTVLRANLATCDLHCDTAISINPHKQVKEYKDRTILVVQA